VFERYAMVSRNDIADAILKLQESEKLAEQERALVEERQAQERAQFGHSGDSLKKSTASRAVN